MIRAGCVQIKASFFIPIYWDTPIRRSFQAEPGRSRDQMVYPYTYGDSSPQTFPHTTKTRFTLHKRGLFPTSKLTWCLFVSYLLYLGSCFLGGMLLTVAVILDNSELFQAFSWIFRGWSFMITTPLAFSKTWRFSFSFSAFSC